MAWRQNSRWVLVFLTLFAYVLSLNEDAAAICSDGERSSYLKYIVKTPSGSSSEAISVKFRSLIYRDVTMWYDNGDEGVFQGALKFTQETTITSYPGHKFFFKYSTPKDSKRIIATVEIISSKVFCLCLSLLSSIGLVSDNRHRRISHSRYENLCRRLR
jgi:hypothetical protein